MAGGERHLAQNNAFVLHWQGAAEGTRSPTVVFAYEWTLWGSGATLSEL